MSGRIWGAVTLVVVAVAATLIWGARRSSRAPDGVTVNAPAVSASLGTPLAKKLAPPANDHATVVKPPPVKLPGFREQMRRSRDYAALIASLSAAASAGDPEAEYVTAEALKYCEEGLKRFFQKPDGTVRSLNEAQARWANRPAGYQQEISDIHDRCHAFQDDDSLKDVVSSWGTWLDKAVSGGDPGAEAEKADLARQAYILKTARSGANWSGDQSSAALDLAVSAAATGDPDALMKMSDWVNPKTHESSAEYGNLSAAWQLAACQAGYDCSPGSEWMRTICDYDPQCANDLNVIDYMRRTLMDRFDTVQQLAQKIRMAVAAGDTTAIRSLL